MAVKPGAALLSGLLLTNAPAGLAVSDWGVEINPFGVLALGTELGMLSSALSYFGSSPNVQLTAPMVITEEPWFSDFDNSGVTLYADPQFRYYLSGQEGFFLIASARYRNTRMENWLKCPDSTSTCDPLLTESARVSSLGLGMGLGYRVQSDSGLYWSATFTMGRYLAHISHDESFTPDDEQLYGDAEFLRIGWRF